MLADGRKISVRRLQHDNVNISVCDSDRRYEIRISVEQPQQCVHTLYGRAPDFSCCAVGWLVEHRLANGGKLSQEFGLGAAVYAAGLVDGTFQDRGQRVVIVTRTALQPGIVEDGFANGGLHTG